MPLGWLYTTYHLLPEPGFTPLIFHDPHNPNPKLPAVSGEGPGLLRSPSGQWRSGWGQLRRNESMPYAPGRMPVRNEGLVWGLPTKMVHNPGGDDCILVENVQKVRCAFPQCTLISISEFPRLPSGWAITGSNQPTSKKSSNQLPSNFDGLILPATPNLPIETSQICSWGVMFKYKPVKGGGFFGSGPEGPEGIHCFSSLWLGRLWKAVVFFFGGGLDVRKIDWYI